MVKVRRAEKVINRKILGRRKYEKQSRTEQQDGTLTGQDRS